MDGGRWTRLGHLGVIAFHAALWSFGWIETGWVLVMLPAMVVLRHAERADQRPAPRVTEATFRADSAVRR